MVCKYIKAENGLLLRSENRAEWEVFDFNGEYAGYYAKCVFTAAGYAGNRFITVGYEESGAIVAYESLMGGVWKSMELSMRTPSGLMRAVWRVNDVVDGVGNGQALLLCDGGWVIAVTGCPKCVKHTKIADIDILSGHVENHALSATLRNGETININLDTVAQIRVSWDYAMSHSETAVYINLSDKRANIECISMSIEDLPEYLNTVCKSQVMYFFCEHGARSDAAAQYARSLGYINAFTLSQTI